MSVPWKEVAENLIQCNWQSGEAHKDANAFIKAATDQRLIMCLLIDIAQSLRVLRCGSFQAIPEVLRGIRSNIEPPKPRKRGRKK